MVFPYVRTGGTSIYSGLIIKSGEVSKGTSSLENIETVCHCASKNRKRQNKNARHSRSKFHSKEREYTQPETVSVALTMEVLPVCLPTFYV